MERYLQQTAQERRARLHGCSRTAPPPRSTTACIVNMFKDNLSRSWSLKRNSQCQRTASDSRVHPKTQALFAKKIQEIEDMLIFHEDEDISPEEDAERNCFTRSLVNKFVTTAYETASKGSEMGESSEVTATVLDCKDGTYMVTYTPSISGEYCWTIVHDGVDVSPADEVVYVAPSDINEHQSVIYGFGMQNAVAGELAHFVLQVMHSEIPWLSYSHTFFLYAHKNPKQNENHSSSLQSY